MLVVDISIDLGRGAAPVELEALFRGVRVATDIGRDVELRRVRRIATEQMKFPTDDELGAAIERLPQGDETSPSYRAKRLLDVRRNIEQSFPPDFWWESWYRGRHRSSEFLSRLSGTGLERSLTGASLPWPAATAGLDVLDPELYHALVAEQVVRNAPATIILREVHYRNPLEAGLAAVGSATGALEKAAGVIETTATLGSRRKIMKAEAEVAQATVADRIGVSQLDLELKQEALRRAQLENAIAEEELMARRIQNAQALDALNAQRSQHALVDHFTVAGQLDESDAIRALDPADASALAGLAARPLELMRRFEDDPADGG